MFRINRKLLLSAFPKKLTRETCAFTLIELLIVIGIMAIIATSITMTLSTSLDTYGVVSDDIVLQKYVDETLSAITDGDYKYYGVRDALELVRADEDAVSFVPIWISRAHQVRAADGGKPQKFFLDKSFKAGAGAPLAQAYTKLGSERYWRSVDMAFHTPGEGVEKKEGPYLTLNETLPPGTQIRFLYHPDTSREPEAVMDIGRVDNHVTRVYNEKTSAIPAKRMAEVFLKELNFQYFDNTNTVMEPHPDTGLIDKDILLNVTAVGVYLKAAFGEKTKEGRAFVSFRNARSAGAGIIIKRGTKLKIADSHAIRAFSLTNITGVKEGDQIILEAKAENKRAWRVEVDLGIKNNKEVIRSYAIYYPGSQKVFSEVVNLTTDIPLDFLTLGQDGKYDYDFDAESGNVVELKGSVELRVLKMDAAGAALFIRP